MSFCSNCLVNGSKPIIIGGRLRHLCIDCLKCIIMSDKFEQIDIFSEGEMSNLCAHCKCEFPYDGILICEKCDIDVEYCLFSRIKKMFVEKVKEKPMFVQMCIDCNDEIAPIGKFVCLICKSRADERRKMEREDRLLCYIKMSKGCPYRKCSFEEIIIFIKEYLKNIIVMPDCNKKFRIMSDYSKLSYYANKQVLTKKEKKYMKEYCKFMKVD
jgi:hypothetical protein